VALSAKLPVPCKSAAAALRQKIKANIPNVPASIPQVRYLPAVATTGAPVTNPALRPASGG